MGVFDTPPFQAIKKATAPSSPFTGMQWYDTTNDLWKRWDGTNWIIAGKVPIVGSSQLQTFRAALANRNFGPCNIFFSGDSITEGQGATNVDNRWQTRFIAGLRDRYPQSVTGGRGYVPAQYASTSFSQLVTASGGAVLGGFGGNSFGLGVRNVTLNSTGKTLTFTTSNVTSIDIHWTAQSAGGTFSYTLDGGSATNVSTVGTQGNEARTQLTGLAAGSHTIVVTWVSGSAVVNGFMCYNGDETTGIRQYDGGHSGATSGNTNSVIVNTSYWGNFLQNFAKPALATIAIGTNDWGTSANPGGSISSAQMATNIQTLITTIRSRSSIPPSIVLIPVYERQPSASYTPAEPWINYVNAMRSVALADGDIAVFDLYNRLGVINTSPLNNRSILADLVHPSDLGHQMIADMLLDFVTGTQAIAGTQ